MSLPSCRNRVNWGIEKRAQPVFGMAGLSDASTRADGSGIEPCAVITIPANARMHFS